MTTSLAYRLRLVANWLRIDAPLISASHQMAEFAAAAESLEALAVEADELEVALDALQSEQDDVLDRPRGD